MFEQSSVNMQYCCKSRKGKKKKSMQHHVVQACQTQLSAMNREKYVQFKQDLYNRCRYTV